MNPIQYLTSIDAGSAEAFQSLRKAVMKSGPLDERACELVVTASFAVVGLEDSFKVHAKRFLALGGDAAELRQAVLVTLAATSNFAQVIAALHWIDDLVAK